MVKPLKRKRIARNNKKGDSADRLDKRLSGAGEDGLGRSPPPLDHLAGATANANRHTTSNEKKIPEKILAPNTPNSPAADEPKGGEAFARHEPAQHKASPGVTAGASGNPYLDFIQRYKDDPVGLVTNVFQVTPDPWQQDFLRKLAAGTRRLSVRAGHGVGKSTGCAWAVIWHLLTRYPQKTICTAPTAPQLYDALFSEIKFWINRLPPFIQSLFTLTSDRITLTSSPEASFVSARTSSKEKPEALAGVHSEHVLLIVDEASGVEEAVFVSATGSMSGHNSTTILIGNPTRNSGLFYKSQNELRAEWSAMHVSCLDSPRVTEDFVKQVIDTWGEASNEYRVRVLGEFPLAEDDTLIAAELVDAAMIRDIQPDPLAPIIFGVDPARFGSDAAVLCVRQGDVVLSFRQWRNLDLMALCGHIVNEIETHRPVEINVDSIGLGAGLADRLRELGYPCRDVNVSEVSAINPKANKLRDDLWWQIKEFLSQRACRLPKDETLRGDLVTPTYSFTSAGKLVVESKPDMKKRLRRSPDYADALGLTFAGQGARIGGRMSGWSTSKPLRRGVSIC